MKKILSSFYCVLFFSYSLFSQSVGIGTNTPNAKAALEIKATDKGVLFPRLTTAQRNAISNAPDGLHIYNKDEHCLNYYDSLYQIWNCYCENDTCKVITINITADACNINFYSAYAASHPGTKKFSVIIAPGVNIACGSAATGAIDFTAMPVNTTIKIINYGIIYGAGGNGGAGAAGQVGSCSIPANNGVPGGHAITTKTGVMVAVSNYGTIAAGGGGGGGGGKTALGQYGGGGGGGATFLPISNGGLGGGLTISFISCLFDGSNTIAQAGTAGQSLTGGIGGAGASGGGNGGNGGALGQSGQNGTNTAAGTGAAGGKAISGGSGNSITNISGGQSFGVVD